MQNSDHSDRYFIFSLNDPIFEANKYYNGYRFIRVEIRLSETYASWCKFV